MPVGVSLGVGLQRYAPRFAPKSLNSVHHSANCNPYLRPGASDVACVCSASDKRGSSIGALMAKVLARGEPSLMSDRKTKM